MKFFIHIYNWLASRGVLQNARPTITGDEVLGKGCCESTAWNFRASERRAELVRAMPSAAENLEEKSRKPCKFHDSGSQ